MSYCKCEKDWLDLSMRLGIIRDLISVCSIAAGDDFMYPNGDELAGTLLHVLNMLEETIEEISIS